MCVCMAGSSSAPKYFVGLEGYCCFIGDGRLFRTGYLGNYFNEFEKLFSFRYIDK